MSQQRAVTPDPESSNSNKKGAKLPLISAEGCHTQLVYKSQQRAVTPDQKVQIQTKRAPNCHYHLQRAVTPNLYITYQGIFFKGGESL
jgi:hypothetical protein